MDIDLENYVDRAYSTLPPRTYTPQQVAQWVVDTAAAEVPGMNWADISKAYQDAVDIVCDRAGIPRPDPEEDAAASRPTSGTGGRRRQRRKGSAAA